MPLQESPLDTFLRKRGSPLAGLGRQFEAIGKQYGVDPRLLVAISGAETSFGSYGPSQRIHNPFGMGPNINYPTYQAAISAAAKNLGQNYIGQGLKTIPQIQGKWAPSAAANDPTGLNNNWVKNVSSYYAQLGGDPHVNLATADYVKNAAQVEQQFAAVGDPAAAQAPQLTADQSAMIERRVQAATPPVLSQLSPMAGPALGDLTEKLASRPLARTPTDVGSNAIQQAHLSEVIRTKMTKDLAGVGMGLSEDHGGQLGMQAAGFVSNVAEYMKTHPQVSGVLTKAKTFLGDPYKWGGSSPKTGFDCSGFAQWLYGQQGVGLPRTTYDQIKAGSAVSMKNLAPGDLIFFGTKKDPHHEGIYIGNGQFIHAPHTGDVIKISALDGYYKQHFVTGRRVTR